MEVNGAQRSHLKKLIWDYLAIGHTDYDIEAKFFGPLIIFADLGWLKNRDTGFEGDLFDWASGKFAASAVWLICLGDDTDHIKAFFKQSKKWVNRDFWSAQIEHFDITWFFEFHHYATSFFSNYTRPNLILGIR